MRASNCLAVAAICLLTGCGIAYEGKPPQLKQATTYWAHQDPEALRQLIAEGSVRPEFVDAISHKQIQMGMNQWECTAAWGWAEVHHSMDAQGQWTQMTFSYSRSITLLNDAVVSVNQS